MRLKDTLSVCAYRGAAEAGGILLRLLIAVISAGYLVQGGPNEKRLLNDLMLTDINKYNRLERPVINESDPLNVTFGFTLQQIIDVDEKNQILTTNIWLNLVWNDYNLMWNETEYGGIKSVRIPAAVIWKPDILMYNSADEKIDSAFATNVVVSSDGGCLWVPPGLFHSTCKIDITWFPFDDQKCEMKFGSWTYDNAGIDLLLASHSGDLSSFIPNGEWLLIDVPAVRNVKTYECCPEQYVDVTFTVHIRRRTLYYGFNLIIPCVLISSMALLAFTLPPDAGEKISLGVTILLSLTVFLLLVAETMPPTSDALPLIGMYFACIMLMCSLSVMFTVLVLNYHHRTPGAHTMPTWVRVIICHWLAFIFCVSRPAAAAEKAELVRRRSMAHAPPNRRGSRSSTAAERAAKKSRSIDTEMSSRSSKSLIARSGLDDDDAIVTSSLYNLEERVGRNNDQDKGEGRLEQGAGTLLLDYIPKISDSETQSHHFTSRRQDNKQSKRKAADYVERKQWRQTANGNKKNEPGGRLANVQDIPVSIYNTCGCQDDEQQCHLATEEKQQCYLANARDMIDADDRERQDWHNNTQNIVGREDRDYHWQPPTNGEEVVNIDTERNLATSCSMYSAADYETENEMDINLSNQHDHDTAEPLANNSIREYLSETLPRHLSNVMDATKRRHLPNRSELAATVGLSRQLSNILEEIRKITDKCRRDEMVQEECSEWKFAAMVIDRMCLVMFTIFTVVSTCAILFSAPNLNCADFFRTTSENDSEHGV